MPRNILHMHMFKRVRVHVYVSMKLAIKKLQLLYALHVLLFCN